MRIKMGDRVKDRDSLYVGTVVARTDYLRGESRIAVKSRVLHDGSPIDWVWFDEDALEPSTGIEVDDPIINMGSEPKEARRL